MKPKVYIYAACDVYYGSYYIKGLTDFFGKKNVHFNAKKFPSFKQNTFAFIVDDSISQKKIIIDFYDSAAIDKTSFDWCDIYGKINLTKTDYENSDLRNKLFPIGPGFGIKIWPLQKAIFVSLNNFLLCYKRLDNYKKFFSNYKSQTLRFDIKQYQKNVSEKDYVFMLNTLWKKEETTNLNRTKFIEACKAIPNIKFEGGFAPRARNDVQGFEKYTTLKRYAFEEYLEKLKKSAIVFNTPAVLDCHGWKLGEFFALGKAIITTPILRILPKELEDGKDVIVLPQNIIDYKSAIEAILLDDEKRISLENNAFNYYIKYLIPAKVIERLILTDNS